MGNELPLSQPSQDDEIDLFELFAVLWAGKWIITAIVGISLAFGFSFSLYKKHNLPGSHFAVIAPYSVNLFRPLYTQICREHLNFSAILKEAALLPQNTRGGESHSPFPDRRAHYRGCCQGSCWSCEQAEWRQRGSPIHPFKGSVKRNGDAGGPKHFAFCKKNVKET